MKTSYRLICRGLRNGAIYCVDTKTGKRISLQTGSKDEARQIIEARNQAERQPFINLQIARAYLMASDSNISTRTWQTVMEEIPKTKKCANQARWLMAIRDKAFDLIRNQTVLGTTAEQFLRVLEIGTVSSNVFLRRIHNFALDMTWSPTPIIPKRRWPAVQHGEKRAVTREEHERIIEREKNPELNAFYQLCWHLGGSQTDVATLTAEDVDWRARTISFARRKTGSPVRWNWTNGSVATLSNLTILSFVRDGRSGERSKDGLDLIVLPESRLSVLWEAYGKIRYQSCCHQMPHTARRDSFGINEYLFFMAKGDRDLESIKVTLNYIVLAAPIDHPLTKLKKLRLRDLKDADFLWLPRKISPALYDRLMRECFSGGIESPRIVQEAVDEATFLSLVACRIPGHQCTEGVFLALAVEWQLPRLDRAQRQRHPGRLVEGALVVLKHLRAGQSIN